MSADPHYWLGWLTMSMARAVKVERPQPELRRDLAEFLRSQAASPELRVLAREEMKRGA